MAVTKNAILPYHMMVLEDTCLGIGLLLTRATRYNELPSQIILDMSTVKSYTSTTYSEKYRNLELQHYQESRFTCTEKEQ